MTNQRIGIAMLAILLLLVVLWPAGGVAPSGPLSVVYVYEHRDDSPTPEVLGALGKLNRDTTRKIMATTFEDDTTDGTDDVPEQFAVAAKAAKEHGVPCLVVHSGERVLKVVKGPKTEADVMGAIP